MRQVPELYVPASERAPRRDWVEVIRRIYAIGGVLAIALALYIGLASMPLGHLREGLLPAAITAICWYGFGQVVSWIFGPALSPKHERR